MKLVYCEQCERLFWAQRKTAKFCSPTCRKASHRGQRKISYYDRLDRHEEIAAVIADQYPKIWRKLEDMRDFHGHKALRSTIEIIELIIQEKA